MRATVRDRRVRPVSALQVDSHYVSHPEFVLDCPVQRGVGGRVEREALHPVPFEGAEKYPARIKHIVSRPPDGYLASNERATTLA